MIIEVWICPNCGNYYGASNAGDLSTTWNEHHGRRTFLRSRCPTRACADEDIHRIPVLVDVTVAKMSYEHADTYHRIETVENYSDIHLEVAALHRGQL